MKQTNRLSIFLLTLLSFVYIPGYADSIVVLSEPGPISVPADKTYTMNEVRKSIISGAMQHEWRIDSDTPGNVRVILDGRKDHVVLVMDVVYNVKSYSIKYVRSDGLKYDQGNGLSTSPQAVSNVPQKSIVFNVSPTPLSPAVSGSVANNDQQSASVNISPTPLSPATSNSATINCQQAPAVVISPTPLSPAISGSASIGCQQSTAPRPPTIHTTYSRLMKTLTDAINLQLSIEKL
ncbi:MAG: hypothetical protein ACXU8A_01235 [Burkholderiaceae bacterium]